MKFRIFVISLVIPLLSPQVNCTTLDQNHKLGELNREVESLYKKVKLMHEKHKALSNKIDIFSKTDQSSGSMHSPDIDELSNSGILNSDVSNSPSNMSESKDIKYIKPNKNSFSFSYAICIPHNTAFANYSMEYHTGHSIGLTYSRHHDWFFWGLQLGSKFFESDKMSNIPLWGDLPATGNNYSTNFSLISGIRHNFNDRFYFQGNLGFGINYSRDEIQLGSTTVKYNETNFYGASVAGIGIQFSEFMSLLIFYEIDAHGDSGRLDTRVFSQFGLKTGFHY